jgi:hypothetical protein
MVAICDKSPSNQIAKTSMKRKLFLLPVVTVAIALLSGCQSAAPDTSKTSAAATETTAVATTPAVVTPPTPAVVTPPPPSKPLLPTIRIKAGGGTVKDSAGVPWLSDIGFGGGDVIDRPDLQIANTQQPEIYRSERYAMDSFTQKLPNGKYDVKLHFCETYEGISGPSERVFTFEVEGKTFKDFDVWAKAGGGARAYIETVPVEIADGQLDIKFTPQIENTQINGIEIIPAP